MKWFDPSDHTADQLAGELRQAVGVLRRRMLREADVGDLTASQEAVLMRLEAGGPQTISGLARAEGVTPQSMRMTVGGLVKVGHLVAARDPADGRQTLHSLSASYRSWIGRGRSIRQTWLSRRIAASLSSQEQAILAEAAALMRRLGS